MTVFSVVYSYRIASIGDRSAAFFAGNTPKKTPIKLDTPKASITAVKLIATGNQIRTTNTIPVANSSPNNPPNADKTTDSVRNCNKTSFLVAPIALRIPISFVLSVTVAYIIFIMPIPPDNQRYRTNGYQDQIQNPENLIDRRQDFCLFRQAKIILFISL